MNPPVRALAVAALCAGAASCAAHHPGAPAPSAPATAAAAAARANAGGWTVRVATLRGDTLVGQLARSDTRTLRLKLRDVALDEVASIERGRSKPDDGRRATTVLAGTLLGGFGGIFAAWAVNFERDAPCDHCVRNWFAFGSIVGFVGSLAKLGNEPPERWETIWRRGP